MSFGGSRDCGGRSNYFPSQLRCQPYHRQGFTLLGEGAFYVHAPTRLIECIKAKTMDSRYARLFLEPYPCKQRTAFSKKNEPYPRRGRGYGSRTLFQPNKKDRIRSPFCLAGIDGFEPSKCQSQSLVPYRLAISQYMPNFR